MRSRAPVRERGPAPRIAGCALAACAVAIAIWAAAWHAGASAIAPLRAAGCEPLQIVDRFERPLRNVPPTCGHRGRSAWLPLHEVPQILQRAVIASEDRRFAGHVGVDPLAVGRAVVQNVRAARTVSGASTITMQLARMLHAPHAERSLGGKLAQAWLAFAIELRLGKREILEAYFNHAYYGHGAYGVADAAAVYFAKAARALSDGEAALLAALPRAPSAYDPRTHLERALRRRAELLDKLVANGQLAPARRVAIDAEPIEVRAASEPHAFAAPHFVDWVLAALPAAERSAGGTLITTLDLDLQQQLESAAREHVARAAHDGVTEAGVVVLDAQSGEVHAMVGSAGPTGAQLNIVTRRRHLGSLLKPFVYALALEGGASPDSIALDVGDATSEYRTRDWVGREAGPLSYREAMAGSYNLAAVDVLERVGVGALHARLRRAGVAELAMPPRHYGLQLALGAARVRLLDVAAGYGFLVREGSVRAPRGVRVLERHTREAPSRPSTAWRPRDAGETRVFSRAVSWLVLDMLADPAARHRRFGRDLPLDGSGQVAAKTGTASGLSDVAAVLASSRWIVAAWAGRFDGAPAHGTSGMWGAAPLARRALEIALRGHEPRLPPRPPELVAIEVCALSGERPGPGCPIAQSLAVAPASTHEACRWHRPSGAETTPSELDDWAARARALAPRTAHATR